jgi:superfamily II DNA or RNA helicase
MNQSEITLKVENNVTYILGKLDSEIYQKLRKHLGYLPEDSFWMLKQKANQPREPWQKEWDGHISCVHYNGNCRCFEQKHGTHFPTGLASKAIQFLKDNGVKVNQFDNRPLVNKTLNLQLSEEVENRPYQEEVIKKACSVDRGIIKMATGSGKSMVASAIIANRGVSPSIFYVPSIDLLTQAKSEIEKFIRNNGLSFEVGQLGGGKKQIRDITVMTIQTAVASLGGKYVKFDDEDNGSREDNKELEGMKKDISDLIHNSKLFIMDECQHTASETCQIISDCSISAKYRWGVSATPFRDKNDDILIESCFGKTIADINASFLILQGYLVQPTIYLIPIKNMKGVHASSYSNVYKIGIVENEERNEKIAFLANKMREDGRNVLILVKQIAHGKTLEAMIDGSLFLHGAHSGKERKTHLDKIRKGGPNITVASQIFDEGIDVRPLDTLILGGGGKSSTRALQRIGRILRPFPGKTDAIVFDFMDFAQYLHPHSVKRKKIYESEPEFIINEYNF